MQSSYSSSSPYRGPNAQSVQVDRLVTGIFRDLSTNETLIEMRRQDLARHPDFEPMKLFEHLDVNRNGQISRNEFYDFMNKQFLNPRISDAEDIVREYDGTQNQMLDFEEFCQLILPSTNPNLRHIASTRRYSPYFRTQQPIPYEVLSLFSRLLDKEMQLQRARSESKRQLAASPDFVKVRVFDSIAKGYHAINMPDLIVYLERNSFFPRREDVEAILRRCDHDANRMISYQEFCELAALDSSSSSQREEGSAQKPASAEADPASKDGEAEQEDQFNDRVEDLDQTDELRQGPREQASADKNQSSAQRRSKKQPADNLTPAQRQQKRDQEERIAAQQREEIEKQIEAEKAKVREEQERRDQEEKERQVENFMFLRFVKLLIRTNRQVEDAKQALFSHKTFNLDESFRLFDINSNGRIAEAELQHVFGEHNIELADLPRLVELVDLDEDGTIEPDEWIKALQPKRPVRGADPAHYLSVEQKNLFQRAWLEQLAALFGLIIETDAEINEKRNQLMLDGARIFSDMDRHNMGYISVNNFANWVSDNCGFQIADEDLPGLETALDGVNDYRITKKGFLETVSPPPTDEDLLQLFKQWDTNGNGKLSHQEIKEGVKKIGLPLTDQELAQAIQGADTNGDGQVDYAEFVRYFRALEEAEENDKQAQAQAQKDSAQKQKQRKQ